MEAFTSSVLEIPRKLCYRQVDQVAFDSQSVATAGVAPGIDRELMVDVEARLSTMRRRHDFQWEEENKKE